MVVLYEPCRIITEALSCSEICPLQWHAATCRLVYTTYYAIFKASLQIKDMKQLSDSYLSAIKSISVNSFSKFRHNKKAKRRKNNTDNCETTHI